MAGTWQDKRTWQDNSASHVHMKTPQLVGDYEANDQRVQSLLLPFASEDSTNLGYQRADDQQKTHV